MCGAKLILICGIVFNTLLRYRRYALTSYTSYDFAKNATPAI